ncbi:phosphoribosylglycinamide formyltransferase [Phenylobacterium immobile]|uniref:phosphoribosylglycinamide formyltransferase n=1 Tax=Phenylobacterium immobile TaxID=21 RepID=UPI000AF9422D|nr:phosphoribosylglycinamide formyltransferase [Phenylobacterium immobile]
MKSPLNLGFLASGNGTSARAIIAAARSGQLAAEPKLMVSNRRDAPALDFARENGVPALHIATLPDAAAADHRLAEALSRHGVDFVVLSGYLRLLGSKVLSRFQGRILNIHPGLLPEFGGHGMYGMRVHEAVIASGVRESGATIHLVDGEYDHGAVVAQRVVPVLPDDSAATLQLRIAAQEPAFFVETLIRIANGELHLPLGGHVIS